MKKKVIFAILAVSIILIAGFSMNVLGDSPFSKGEILEEDDDQLAEFYEGVEEQKSINLYIDEQRQADEAEEQQLDTALVSDESDLNALSNQQKRQIESLRKEGNKLCGIFMWQEKIITGEIQADSDRLDLDKVKSIIADNKSFTDILNEFEKSQKYPDYVGGSGATIIEYWLDKNGDDKIVIILEQETIALSTPQESAESANWEFLFE